MPARLAGPRLMARYARAKAGVLLLDGEGSIREANPAACRLFGLSEEALRGLSFEALVDSFSWPKALGMLREARELSFTGGWELNLVGPTSLRLAHVTAQTAGKGLWLFFQDLQMATALRLIETNESIDAQNRSLERLVAERTQALVESNQTLERRVAERTDELRTEKRRFEAILHSSADGIIATDGTGAVTAFNPAIAHLTGLSAEQALGRSLGDILPSLELAAGAGYDYREFDLRHAQTDERVPVSVSIAPLSSQQGAGWVLVIRDNRDLKAVERQREDFIATLVHDLKTPVLAAIKATEHLQEGIFGAVTEPQAMVHRTMLDSHRRMLQLINSLIDVYRYEAGQKQLKLEAMSLGKLVARCTSELRPLFDAGGIGLDLEVPEGLRVFGDELELGRLLANLLSNAIAHSPPGASVRVTADETDGMVRLRVTDQGPGISEEDQQRLFGRFVQPTPSATGTGLGLFLCRQIAHAHGGSIGVESKPGAGATFWVRLLGASQEETDERAD